MKHETLDMPSESTIVEQPLSKTEALAVAERCITLLKTRFGAKRVIVFGSAVGQAPWHEGSDLDLAVEGIRPEDFFTAWSAVEEMVPPGLEVDLVDLASAYPEMRARILGEVEMPEEPILALKSLIADELKALERVTQELGEARATCADPPTHFEMRAMALMVHEFYTGIESILERIAVQIDSSVPKTAHWHADLLKQMNEPQEGLRPAVIDDRLWARLKFHLSFRDFIRHAYGYDLEWERLYPHVQAMPNTLTMLRDQLERFFAAVRSDERQT